MAEKYATFRVGKASGGLLVLSVAMAAGIFAFDLSLPLDIAGGVPYVALVLIGLWLPWRHSLLVLAAIGSALTLIGFLFPAEIEFPWAGMLNRALALLAIWAVAVLAFERKKSEAALNASRHRHAEHEEPAARLADTKCGAFSRHLSDPFLFEGEILFEGEKRAMAARRNAAHNNRETKA